MNTTIRRGKVCFYGDKVFPHGISRSSYFNRRESEELRLYGHTFEALLNGTIQPENEEETHFVEDMLSDDESSLYPVQLWRKYLTVIKQSKTHHGFAKSYGREIEPFNGDVEVL